METVSNKQKQLNRDATAFYLHAAMRQNLVFAMELKETDRVLLVEKDEPAIEKAVQEKVNKLITAEAEKLIADNNNTICEAYDVIICLGEKPTSALLTVFHRLLTRDGRLYLAFDNYLQNTDSICKQEQMTKDTCKCSLQGAKRALARAGLVCHQVWYPYPDWRFMYSVFSDAFMPSAKELASCHNRLDNRKPEQTKMWEQAIADDMFFYLAPAFLICAGRPKQNERDHENEEKGSGPAETTVYWRFSNDRQKQLAIYTRIGEKEKKRFVEKGSIFTEGQEHIDRMFYTFENLCKQYAHPVDGTNITCRINKCQKQGNKLWFEYINGRSVEEIVLESLAKGQTEKAKTWVKIIAALVRSGEEHEFEASEQFTQMFGDVGEVVRQMGLTVRKTTNIDPLLSNFLLQDNVITMIDYEWTFTFPIPADYAVYRMVFYLVHNHTDVELLQQIDWYGMLGISQDSQTLFMKMEQAFQTYLQGSEVSERSQYECYLSETQKNLRMMPTHTQIAYYWDDGNGFSAQNVKWINGNSQEGIVIPLLDGSKKVRLDLSEEPCLICLKEPLPLDEIDGNGFWLSDTQVLFTEPDPQIVGLARGQDKKICVSFDCYEVPGQLVEQMTGLMQRGKDDAGQRAYLEEKIAQMEASASWKVTKPLRKLKGK